MHIGHYIFDSPGPYSNLYAYIEELSNYTESITRQTNQLGQCLTYSHFIISILIAKLATEESNPDNKGNQYQAYIRYTYPEQLSITNRFQLTGTHSQSIIQNSWIQMGQNYVFG